MRLSTMSFAGTARTLVAVGTCKLSSMLVTTRADAPLSFSVTTSGSVTLVVGVGSGVSRDVTGAEVVTVDGAAATDGVGAGATRADVATGGVGVGVGVAGTAVATTGTADVACAEGAGFADATAGAVGVAFLGFTGDSSLGW